MPVMGKELEMSVKPPSATGLLFRATSCVAEPLRYLVFACSLQRCINAWLVLLQTGRK
jgi:hypothetical protein